MWESSLLGQTLSYDCPFQTPVSRTLRYFGINQPPEGQEPDSGAGCILWALDNITDPGMTTAALRHLIDIRWHSSPSKGVPFPQVAQIYMKCFDPSHNLISEYQTMAHEAARALVHLCVHRLCSGRDPDSEQKDVIDALRHLSDTQDSSDLKPLSTIVRSIREPHWADRYRWEMGDLDLPWVSELWMYRTWLSRVQLGGYVVGGIFTEKNMLAPVETLFKKRESPPPRVVRNILYGLRAGISSSALPLDDFLNLQLWETSFLPGSNQS